MELELPEEDGTGMAEDEAPALLEGIGADDDDAPALLEGISADDDGADMLLGAAALEAPTDDEGWEDVAEEAEPESSVEKPPSPASDDVFPSGHPATRSVMARTAGRARMRLRRPRREAAQLASRS